MFIGVGTIALVFGGQSRLVLNLHLRPVERDAGDVEQLGREPVLISAVTAMPGDSRSACLQQGCFWKANFGEPSLSA